MGVGASLRAPLTTLVKGISVILKNLWTRPYKWSMGLIVLVFGLLGFKLQFTGLAKSPGFLVESPCNALNTTNVILEDISVTFKSSFRFM